MISIYITHRETREEHINNVLFVADLSGGEFSAIVLILLHTPAHHAESPNLLLFIHGSKLPEAEPHRLGCRLVLYYTSGFSQNAALWLLKASYGKRLMWGVSRSG